MNRQASTIVASGDATRAHVSTVAPAHIRGSHSTGATISGFLARPFAIVGAPAKALAVLAALLISTGGLWFGGPSSVAATDDHADHGTTPHEDGGMDASGDVVAPDQAGVSIEWTTAPATPQPGQPVTLTYQVVDAAGGQAITDLPAHHERPMHLIVVSSDLTQFQHIHPVLTADGSYQVETTLPAGTYRLYNEFVRGEQTVLDQRELTVGDTAPTAARLTSALAPKAAAGLTVALEPPETIAAGTPASFTLEITRDGQPVTDLTPYLGAAAHVAIVAEDGSGFAHTHGEAVIGNAGHSEDHGQATTDHGTAEHDLPAAFGPRVQVEHTFPAAGHYKLWAQFQHAGQVITVPFVVEVH